MNILFYNLCTIILSIFARNKYLILALLAGMLLSCYAHEAWQTVQYEQSLAGKIITTHCDNDGQTWEKANVYLDNDTLVIAFWAQLPAYWEDIVIKVYDGKFCAETSGIPFMPGTVSFRTVKQQLKLDKKQYTAGDTLQGVFSFIFRCQSIPETENEDEATEVEYVCKGTVCEVVREPDFDPFDEKNFMTFDLPTALHELGEPLERDQFNMLQLYGFRRGLRDRLPASADIRMEELTWDSSPTRQISDEGEDRLTIWYNQTDGVHWQPVLFLRWNNSKSLR